jgi:hypothetical protein
MKSTIADVYAHIDQLMVEIDRQIEGNSHSMGFGISELLQAAYHGDRDTITVMPKVPADAHRTVRVFPGHLGQKHPHN